MWHPTTNQNAIPPNLLKNFNVYETLEPERNGGKTSDVTTVKLLDIDDCSQDSSDTDLSASFFDRNSECSLIDLYQNIFVGPQHVKQKNEFIDDDSNSSTLSTNVSEQDYSKFFDIFESGAKIDWTKEISNVEEETITKEEILEKPRVLVPKVMLDSDSEDLIDEVLSKKNIEKRLLKQMYESKEPAKRVTLVGSYVKDLTPSKELKETSGKSMKIIGGFLQDDKRGDMKESPKNIVASDFVKDVTSNLSKLKLNNTPEDFKFTQNTDINPNVVNGATKSCIVNGQINNSFTDFTVHAMKKDEKIYKKKRIVKPIWQTCNYTKGADLYEKSVVLPQIMARMVAREKHLAEKACRRKVLVLDGGMCEKNKSAQQRRDDVVLRPNCMNSEYMNSKIYVGNTAKKVETPIKKDLSPGELNPVVLMEDCNKERLKSHMQSQMFKHFIYNAK